MTEKDDRLLTQFFEETRQHLADDNFSLQVIQSLPSSLDKKGRLWFIFCSLLGISFFIFVRGWELLTVALKAIFVQFHQSLHMLDFSHFSPAILFVLFLTSLFVVVDNLSMSQE